MESSWRLLKTVWNGWKRVAHKIGDFQARLLLSVFYFGVLGPFALGMKLCSDPLRVGRRATAGWLVRPEVTLDPHARAQRQF